LNRNFPSASSSIDPVKPPPSSSPGGRLGGICPPNKLIEHVLGRRQYRLLDGGHGLVAHARKNPEELGTADMDARAHGFQHYLKSHQMCAGENAGLLKRTPSAPTPSLPRDGRRILPQRSRMNHRLANGVFARPAERRRPGVRAIFEQSMGEEYVFRTDAFGS
jgi:hypothetical protein